MPPPPPRVPPSACLAPCAGATCGAFLGTHDCAECPEAQISAWNERKSSLPTKRTLHASYQKAMAEAESLLANGEAATVAPAEAPAEE